MNFRLILLALLASMQICAKMRIIYALLASVMMHSVSILAMQQDATDFFAHIEQQRDRDLEERQNELSALHTASERGYVTIIQDLLDQGVDINACDKSNRTALFRAVEMGRKEAVKVLLSNGADPDAAADALGMSKLQEPIDLSISTVFDDKQRKITKMLALYGASSKNTSYQLMSVLRNVSFKDQPWAAAVVCGEVDSKIDWENYPTCDKEYKYIIIALAAKWVEVAKWTEKDGLLIFECFFKSKPDLLKKTGPKAFMIAVLRAREHTIDILWPFVKEDEKTVHKTFAVIQNLLKYATLSPEQRTSYQKTKNKILADRITQNFSDSYFSELSQDIRTMIMEYYAGDTI